MRFYRRPATGRKPGYSRRRNFKRSTFKRKRFSKKTFTKNNAKIATIKSQQIPNGMNVKFNWDQTILMTTPATSMGQANHFWMGNSFIPSPADQVGMIPASGDLAPPNITQWSQFYDQILVFGSSIKLQVQFSQNSPQAQMLECVLVAMPYSASGTTIASTISSFSAISFNDACSLPYAHRFDLICNSANAKSGHFYKMFRKVKTMNNVKDVKDNQLYYQLLLTTASALSQPSEGFLYCLKLQNTGSASCIATVQARMSIYAMLDQRRTITQVALTP